MVVETKVRALRESEERLANEARRLLADHEVAANELEARLERQLTASPPSQEQFELADDGSKVIDYLA